jgi:hypothetical protein
LLSCACMLLRVTETAASCCDLLWQLELEDQDQIDCMIQQVGGVRV